MTAPDLHILEKVLPSAYDAAVAHVMAWLSHQIYQPDTAATQVQQAGGVWIPIDKSGHVDAALVLVGDFSAVMVFRGTEPPSRRTMRETLQDWRANFRAAFTPGPYGGSDYVHSGYSGGLPEVLDSFNELWKQRGGTRRLWITGHSKGGAEAILAAGVLAAAGSPLPSAVYTYGSPRVGNSAFCLITDHLVGLVVRHQHGTDPVPLWPHVGWRGWSLPGCYRHCGDLVYYPPEGKRPIWNPSWLRLHWLRWQGLRGGLWQLLGDRLKDHAHATYLAACRDAAHPVTQVAGVTINTTNNSNEGKP
jgi:hypothetical protein